MISNHVLLQIIPMILVGSPQHQGRQEAGEKRRWVVVDRVAGGETLLQQQQEGNWIGRGQWQRQRCGGRIGERRGELVIPQMGEA